MSDWQALTDELDAWSAAGRIATFWWRDDDAITPTAALDRLLRLADDYRVPFSLAVIPALASAKLFVALHASPAAVLQHGFAHHNHAPAGAKKAEFGPHRPLSAMAAELRSGRQRLEDSAGGQWKPVLVPPWNRIDVSLLPMMRECGLVGLSTFGPRPASIAGLAQSNTHVDIIDWHAGRRYAGAATPLAQAVAHLRARRLGAVAGNEPTGFLTHHLVHDAAAWDFVGRFITATAAHPSARWLDADAVFLA